MQLVKRIFSISIAASFVASSLVCAEQVSESFVAPDLQQESQHKKAIQRIDNWFSRYHYKKIQLNDELSAKMWDKFLRNIDYNKSLFLASDVAKFEKFKNKFDDGMNSGDLSFAFEIYE